MKTLMIVPDGVGIRNFLCTGFVDRMRTKGPVHIWHALPEAGLAPHRARWGDAVQWTPLPRYREGLPERLLRQAKIDAQLYWKAQQDNSAIAFRRRRRAQRWPPRLIARTARTVGRLASHQRGVAWLDRAHARAALRASYLEPFSALVRAEQPDVVFCVHQRASTAVPAMLAARQEGVPTVNFIYSWDNLPKGRMAVHADHFLVWSDFMRDQMRTYYPEVQEERLHVVGTPQFEHYVNDDLREPRTAFFARHGLDPDRPVVCFSGDDVSTSPFDPVYLEDLAKAVAAMPAANRPQILFRRCPVDTSDRFDAVIARHPDMAVSDPQWLRAREGDWTQVVPTLEDVALLVNVVAHCDLVVNLGSTMALDFAILDKPAIYVAYAPAGADDGWSVEDVYRLPHFAVVHDLDPVHWARSADDLARLVAHALAHPDDKRDARQRWLETTARTPLGEASARCAAAVEAIAQAPGRTPT